MSQEKKNGGLWVVVATAIITVAGVLSLYNLVTIMGQELVLSPLVMMEILLGAVVGGGFFLLALSTFFMFFAVVTEKSAKVFLLFLKKIVVGLMGYKRKAEARQYIAFEKLKGRKLTSHEEEKLNDYVTGDIIEEDKTTGDSDIR